MRFLAAFSLIALAEVATFFWVGSEIGLIWALALAVATALIGAALVRKTGLSALSRIKSRFNQGQMPGRELSDGAAILVAGAFLISPGFITDVLGFLLLIPAVRASIHRTLSKRFSTRMTVFAGNQTPRQGGPSPSWSPDRLGGGIIEVDTPDRGNGDRMT
jgi:UPF0716 protein FxsA